MENKILVILSGYNFLWLDQFRFEKCLNEFSDHTHTDHSNFPKNLNAKIARREPILLLILLTIIPGYAHKCFREILLKVAL